MEGNLRFKIGWAILIVGSKFIVFALFYFAYIWRGDLMQGFLRYRFGGLIFGGAHFWNFMFYDCQFLFLNGRNTTVPN